MRKLSLKFRQALTMKEEPARDKALHDLLPGSPSLASKKPRSHTLSPEALDSLSEKQSFLKRGRSATGPTVSIPLLFDESFHSNEDDVFLADALELLQSVIRDRDRKQRLIQRLLEFRANYVVRIRFCGAVDELNDTVGKAERLSKQKSIVRLFVCEGCSFPLGNLSVDVVTRLTAGRYDLLDSLRRQVLEELARDDNVVDACRAL